MAAPPHRPGACSGFSRAGHTGLIFPEVVLMTKPCQRDGQHGQVGRDASHVPPTAISPSPGVTPSAAAGPRVTPAWGRWSASGTAVGTRVCEHTGTAGEKPKPGWSLGSRSPGKLTPAGHTAEKSLSPCPPQRIPFHSCPESRVCPYLEAHTAIAFPPAFLPKTGNTNLVLTCGVPPPTSQLSKGSVRVPPLSEEVGPQRGKSSHLGHGQVPHLWGKDSGMYLHGHGNPSSCGKGQLEATYLMHGWITSLNSPAVDLPQIDL